MKQLYDNYNKKITKCPETIPADAIKADIETSIEILYDLIGKIWEQEVKPTEWKEGYPVKLPKKGDMQECQNYGGIMLLSVPGKVLNRVILDRRRGWMPSSEVTKPGQ